MLFPRQSLSMILKNLTDMTKADMPQENKKILLRNSHVFNFAILITNRTHLMHAKYKCFTV